LSKPVDKLVGYQQTWGISGVQHARLIARNYNKANPFEKVSADFRST